MEINELEKKIREADPNFSAEDVHKVMEMFEVKNEKKQAAN